MRHRDDANFPVVKPIFGTNADYYLDLNNPLVQAVIHGNFNDLPPEVLEELDQRF